MKNGICPKCGSESVYSKADGLKFSPMQGLVFVDTGRPLSASSAIAYVCTSCGYFENFITDQNKLALVQKNWQKADPASHS